jgi:His-Xaa-Ser system radical SAM maturase HxsC
MLKLHGKTQEIKFSHLDKVSVDHRIYLLSTNTNLPSVLKEARAYIVRDTSNIPVGFHHYLIFEDSYKWDLNIAVSHTVISHDYDYLGDGDVISINKEKSFLKVLYRKNSPHNNFLVTEQCNHFCLMCSQPPKQEEDAWILDEISAVIPLMSKDTAELGFTGGEPTLRGDRFLDILRLVKNHLPRTSVHVLSNGRSFADFGYASRYASINHHDMMVGIPLYSDDPVTHDYIVQAKGAFDETILGILNLKRLNQKVEIRVVIHRQSVARLKQLCEFIARNLLFVDHVALMGLEMMGFTRLNINDLWIDQYDYKDTLSDAVNILVSYGINVSVYNHQLCLVNDDVLPYYKKSISDWKNEYLSECNDCSRKSDCGGFFSSSLKYRYSKHISPIYGSITSNNRR